LAIATKLRYAKATYEYEFGHEVKIAIEQGETEGVMDMWFQLSIQSSAALTLDVNIL
jgi:hypothetical protein